MSATMHTMYNTMHACSSSILNSIMYVYRHANIEEVKSNVQLLFLSMMFAGAWMFVVVPWDIGVDILYITQKQCTGWQPNWMTLSYVCIILMCAWLQCVSLFSAIITQTLRLEIPLCTIQLCNFHLNCSGCKPVHLTTFGSFFIPQQEIKAKLGGGRTNHTGPSFVRLRYIRSKKTEDSHNYDFRKTTPTKIQ